MDLKIKNIILVGLLGAVSGLVNAGLINDVPYAMRDLHTFFSEYQDYKKINSQVIRNNQVDTYYSPSSIKRRTGERGNWEEYTYYTVVMKTANKYGYALEAITLECGSNKSITYNRLYYGNDHQVLPQARQKLLVGSRPTVTFSPQTNTGKIQKIICDAA